MRLFIAVNPADSVRQQIWRISSALREAAFPIRWVDPAGMHVTLTFLGDVDAAREPQIVAGLEAACSDVTAFDASGGAIGAFPNADRPRIVWVGCEPTRAFAVLQHEIETEMHRLGFPRDGRAFRPHLTIGRVRRGAGRCVGLGDRLSDIHLTESVVVHAVDLMESTLTRSGARYTRRYTASLRGA
jgi:2'-5' RNA ligase